MTINSISKDIKLTKTISNQKHGFKSCEQCFDELLGLEHWKSFCHRYHNRFVQCDSLCASEESSDLQNFCYSRDKEMALAHLTSLESKHLYGEYIL